MKRVYRKYGAALCALACLGFSGVAYGQAETTIEVASPEPGDTPAVLDVEVNAQPGAEVEVEVESSSAPDVDTSAPGVLPSPLETSVTRPSSIDQRVDETNTNEAIRVAPRSRKNVSRLDNRPDRPRIKPIAVIQGPMSPWGYTARYMNGEVERKSAKELQGKTDTGPGAQRQGGLTGGSSSGGGGRAAARRSRE